MTCGEAQRQLPGYLDGAIRMLDRAHVSEHLDSCVDCRGELESFRRLAVCLANVQPVAVPADLVTRIRVKASRSRTFPAKLRYCVQRAKLVFENILEPLAVPATGGILTALVVFILLVQNILVGVPVGVVPGDLPLNLVQQAQVESLAPFAVPGLIASDHDPAAAVTVEATLDADGNVVSYRIISGQSDATVRNGIEQVLMFSHFRPRLDFGRPTNGGRVMIGFSEVRVRG
ncbi:MAG: anti-sigma factor family protein [Candidatus Acidiferrales bacterium]